MHLTYEERAYELISEMCQAIRTANINPDFKFRELYPEIESIHVEMEKLMDERFAEDINASDKPVSER